MSMLSRFGLAVSAALVLAAGCTGFVSAQNAEKPAPPAPPEPQAAAPIKLKDLQGKTFDLNANKGKVVFVNFFATWCGPCRAEFPEVTKLHEKYQKQDVRVVSLSVDDDRTRSRVRAFAEAYKAKHPVLTGTEAEIEKIARGYNVRNIPTNVLIGRDGNIKAIWIGFRGEEDMKNWQAQIDEALKAEVPDK